MSNGTESHVYLEPLTEKSFDFTTEPDIADPRSVLSLAPLLFGPEEKETDAGQNRVLNAR